MSGEPKMTLTADDLKNVWQTSAFSSFLLLDGSGKVNMPRFIYTLDNTPDEYFPLYANTIYRTILDVSPLLVKVGADSPLLEWFLEEGAWRRQGVIVRSGAGFSATVRHLQLILEFSAPSDEVMLFRYYDPVVMEYMAPVLHSKQLFRGPLEDFVFSLLPERKFARLYGDVEQPENMRDTSAMNSPIISFDEREMKVMSDGARQAFCHVLAGLLQAFFESADYDLCLERARQAVAACDESGVNDAATMEMLARLIMAEGSLSPGASAILSDSTLDDVAKMAQLQQYSSTLTRGAE